MIVRSPITSEVKQRIHSDIRTCAEGDELHIRQDGDLIIVQIDSVRELARDLAALHKDHSK
jgi:hypothetical protein